jgi:hypothetical protein
VHLFVVKAILEYVKDPGVLSYALLDKGLHTLNLKFNVEVIAGIGELSLVIDNFAQNFLFKLKLTCEVFYLI